MILRNISVGVLVVVACLLIAVVGASITSTIYFLVTGQEWTDFGAGVAGGITGIVALITLGIWCRRR